MVTMERSEQAATSTRLRVRRLRIAGVALVALVVGSTLSVAGAASAETAKATPTLTFTKAPIADFISPGSLPGVTATINPVSGSPLTGVLTLRLHRPRTTGAGYCSGTVAHAVELPLDSVTVATTITFPPFPVRDTDQGIWGWQAVYSGDANNEAASTGCRTTLVQAKGGGGIDLDPSNPDIWRIEALITRQYKALLNRSATRAELDSWGAKIIRGEATVGHVSADIRKGDDHVKVVDPAVRLYSAYFLRTPDYKGLVYWIGQLRGGRSLVSASDFFSQSPEFVRTYGSLSNAGFVDLVYTNILGRGGDANGKTFWNAQLDQGLRSRGDVMVGFSESPEYSAAMANEVHVAVLYTLLVGRSPSADEFETMVALLDLTDTAKPFTVVDLANDLLKRGS